MNGYNNKPGFEKILMKCEQFENAEELLEKATVLYEAMMRKRGDEWIDNDDILDKMGEEEYDALIKEYLEYKEKVVH